MNILNRNVQFITIQVLLTFYVGKKMTTVHLTTIPSEPYTDNKYILLDVLVCIVAEYFYELCHILISPQGESKKEIYQPTRRSVFFFVTSIQFVACALRENLSNRSSGLQISRDICTRFGCYLYSTKCDWIINVSYQTFQCVVSLYIFTSHAVFWRARRGVKIQMMSKNLQRYYTLKCLIRDLLSNVFVSPKF